MRLLRLGILVFLLPFNAWSACSGNITGQSATHLVTISDTGCKYDETMLQVYKLNALDGSYGDEPQQLAVFANSCTLDKRGLRCKNSGSTILSGTVYRWTNDTNPQCPGERVGSRLTCVSGCKAAPQYLYSIPYEC